eukprot:gene11008-12171_t
MAESFNLDAANWMSNLPEPLQKKPITDLCIPGSHDSGTFYLDKNSNIAPDESKTIKVLVRIFGKIAKNIIYRWSVTQDLNLTEQLEHGVRYLDLRVAYEPKVKDFRAVHGLYGLTYKELFGEIADFLNKHPKEIVILDFNHLMSFNQGASQELITLLMKSLGQKLYGPGKLGPKSSLSDIWAAKKQVIALYADAAMVPKNPLLWSQNDIYSPWPDTTSSTTLIGDLNKRFDDLKLGALNVFQAILTPKTSTIFLHLCKGSLKTTLAQGCDNCVSGWLDTIIKDKKKGINILICDFAGYNDIAVKIISMNYMNLIA